MPHFWRNAITMHKLVLALLILILAPAAQALTIATWNAKHLGWGEQRDWDATAKVVAIYDFVALQEVHGEDAVKRLVNKLEVLTGEPWSSLVSDEAVGRGRYTENGMVQKRRF
jgi:endonuclease/exonuclease/phosphatase family metal-dependent hydrolase